MVKYFSQCTVQLIGCTRIIVHLHYICQVDPTVSSKNYIRRDVYNSTRLAVVLITTIKFAVYNGNFYLGNTTTVFQAEVTAIQKSAEMLIKKQMVNQTITFFSDSQASLAALDHLTVNLTL